MFGGLDNEFMTYYSHLNQEYPAKLWLETGTDEALEKMRAVICNCQHTMWVNFNKVSTEYVLCPGKESDTVICLDNIISIFPHRTPFLSFSLSLEIALLRSTQMATL